MRLAKLHLELFRHFEDAHFDFGGSVSPKDSDFHVIYGPNEAGKSTLMEGYLRLLYGFPKRDQYAFHASTPKFECFWSDGFRG